LLLFSALPSTASALNASRVMEAMEAVEIFMVVEI
jgi:hypothetical protein